MELHPPSHLSVVGIEKGAFRSPSTKVANNQLFYKKISGWVLFIYGQFLEAMCMEVFTKVNPLWVQV